MPWKLISPHYRKLFRYRPPFARAILQKYRHEITSYFFLIKNNWRYMSYSILNHEICEIKMNNLLFVLSFPGKACCITFRVGKFTYFLHRYIYTCEGRRSTAWRIFGQISKSVSHFILGGEGRTNKCINQYNYAENLKSGKLMSTLNIFQLRSTITIRLRKLMSLLTKIID